MRISDWSSDVCSSDLQANYPQLPPLQGFFSKLVKSVQDDGNHSRLDAIHKRCCLRQAAIFSINPGKNARNHYHRSSEERRVSKESVNTCRSRESTYH